MESKGSDGCATLVIVGCIAIGETLLMEWAWNTFLVPLADGRLPSLDFWGAFGICLLISLLSGQISG